MAPSRLLQPNGPRRDAGPDETGLALLGAEPLARPACRAADEMGDDK